MNNLHDSVERWLVQEDYSIIETKTEDNFKIIIKNIDAFSNDLEIFEPHLGHFFAGHSRYHGW